MRDSCTEVALIRRAACERFKLAWTADGSPSILTSAGQRKQLPGRLSEDICVVYASGTAGEATYPIPGPVLVTDNTSFDLLLPVQHDQHVGAVIDTLAHTVSYCPGISRGDLATRWTIPLAKPSAQAAYASTDPSPNVAAAAGGQAGQDPYQFHNPDTYLPCCFFTGAPSGSIAATPGPADGDGGGSASAPVGLGPARCDIEEVTGSSDDSGPAPGDGKGTPDRDAGVVP